MSITNRPFLWGFVLLSVSLSYWLYKPLPPSIEEQWIVRPYIMGFESIMDFGFFCRRLGISNWINILRGILDFVSVHVLFKGYPGGLIINDEVFDGVPVRIYQPAASAKGLTGAIVYYHGGGWIFGSLALYDPATVALAMESGLPVISVDYRLILDVQYPVPLEDCVTATVHFLRHAKQYNVDPNRIVIMGDSAGGNLAAAVALRLTQLESVPKPAGHVLIYPVLQAFDLRLPSHLDNIWNVFIVTKAATKHFLMYMGIEVDERIVEAILVNNHTSADMKKEYAHIFDVQLLPEICQSDKYKLSFHEGLPDVVARLKDRLTDPYIWPLMAPPEMTKKLPSAYVITAGYDALRDDGILYGKKLANEGIHVELADYPNAYHPFMLQLGTPFEVQIASQALSDMVRYVKKMVAST